MKRNNLKIMTLYPKKHKTINHNDSSKPELYKAKKIKI